MSSKRSNAGPVYKTGYKIGRWLFKTPKRSLIVIISFYILLILGNDKIFFESWGLLVILGILILISILIVLVINYIQADPVLNPKILKIVNRIRVRVLSKPIIISIGRGYTILRFFNFLSRICFKTKLRVFVSCFIILSIMCHLNSKLPPELASGFEQSLIFILPFVVIVAVLAFLSSAVNKEIKRL